MLITQKNGGFQRLVRTEREGEEMTGYQVQQKRSSSVLLHSRMMIDNNNVLCK